MWRIDAGADKGIKVLVAQIPDLERITKIADMGKIAAPVYLKLIICKYNLFMHLILNNTCVVHL